MRLSGLDGCSENGCCCGLELGEGGRARTPTKGLVTHLPALNDGKLCQNLLGLGAQLFSVFIACVFSSSATPKHFSLGQALRSVCQSGSSRSQRWIGESFLCSQIRLKRNMYC